jgi:hypothetical protein
VHETNVSYVLITQVQEHSITPADLAFHAMVTLRSLLVVKWSWWFVQAIV